MALAPYEPPEDELKAEARGDSYPSMAVTRWAERIWLTIWGILLPLPFVINGSLGIARGEITFVGGRPLRLMLYSGGSARGIGIFVASVALLYHFHLIWLRTARFHWVGELGILLSLVGIITGTFSFAIVEFFMR
jgi:hypothetical protein